VDYIERINELLAAKPSEKPDKATRMEAVEKVRREWALGDIAATIGERT